MKKSIIAVCGLMISAACFAGEPSDLERSDLARIEFGEVDNPPSVFEVRDDHFVVKYRKDYVTKFAVYTVNGTKRFETDTLNAVGKYPKFDDGALMMQSTKSRINGGYYPLAILYTSGELKKLPDTWSEATEFVDGLAQVMDRKTKMVHYVDTKGNKVYPHLDWENKYNSSLPDIRPLIDNRRAFRDGKGLWGFIDGTGQVVVPAQYYNVRDFSDGHAGVTVKMDDGSYKIGFINTMGEFTCKPMFRGNKNYWNSEIGDVSSGRFLVHEGRAYRYYDTQGNLVREIEGPYGTFCRPFVDGYAMVYTFDEDNDNKQTLFILGTDMATVAQYVDRYGEHSIDDGIPVFVKCGDGWLAQNSGATRIIRPDGTFVIGPKVERGDDGWEPWDDVFGRPQRDGYIFARRRIADEDYYGYVLTNGQFRILFDRDVVYSGAPGW